MKSRKNLLTLLYIFYISTIILGSILFFIPIVFVCIIKNLALSYFLLGVAWIYIPLFFILLLTIQKKLIKKADSYLQPCLFEKIYTSACPIGKKSPKVQMALSYYKGDFQSTIDYAASQLQISAHKNSNAIYYLYLAASYFALADFSKLNQICDIFEKERPKCSPYVANHMKIYRAFIEKDSLLFAEALSLCQKYKSQIPAFSFLHFKFIEAVFSYHIDNKQKSEQLFNMLYKKAPELWFGSISFLYLQQDNVSTVEPFKNILPHPVSVHKHVDTGHNKKAKNTLAVNIICLIIAAFFFWISYDIYENSPYTYFDSAFDEYSVVDTCRIDYYPDYPFTIYILNVEDHIVLSQEALIIRTDAQFDVPYLLNPFSFPEEVDIAFALITKNPQIAKDNCNILFREKFSFQNEDAWLYIYSKDL